MVSSLNHSSTEHRFKLESYGMSLGEVVSGYRVRDGDWAEIGRISPQLPEMFYNVQNEDLTIESGDILVSWINCTHLNS